MDYILTLGKHLYNHSIFSVDLFVGMGTIPIFGIWYQHIKINKGIWKKVAISTIFSITIFFYIELFEFLQMKFIEYCYMQFTEHCILLQKQYEEN